MTRAPAADSKTEWDISTILEAFKACHPLVATDIFTSTYDKWYQLAKSMRKTIAVDQDKICLLRTQYSEVLIAYFGDMPEEHESSLLSKFTKAQLS